MKIKKEFKSTRRLPIYLAVCAVLFASIYKPAVANTQQIKANTIQEELAKLEASSDERIGISAINTANNSRIQYRAAERFPIQSTFKVMAVSDILKQSMSNDHLLQQKITYSKQDLVFWSPITEKHLADGMTISELCSAAMMYSDNTATNLIVKEQGGPKAVTAFARSIGDSKFRIESWEPELNSDPRDIHDTSTPIAMEKSLKKLVFGNVLALPQKKLLVTWMKSNTTGDTRIRAGVPKGWIVADKTGAGNDYGISNDIGIIWPTNCPPIVVAIYSIHNKKNAVRRDDVIASATRMLINEYSRTDQCIKIAIMK
jgi:beta-lactamase class A